MVARQLFICSAIEKCRETANCCHHKIPHIKDERCVPRECRYAAGAENIDCDQYDPAHPRAQVPVPVAPVKTVEQKMKETVPKKILEDAMKKGMEEATEIIERDLAKETGQTSTEQEAKEQGIKEAVKKASQKQPKATKKTQGRKKGE